MSPRLPCLVMLLTAVALIAPATAQKKVAKPTADSTIVLQNGKAVNVRNIEWSQNAQADMQAVLEAQKKAAAAQTQAAANSKQPQKKDDKKKDDGKSKDGKGKDEKKEGISKVKRPQTFDGTPDPNELKLKPDAQNRVQFNFTGQPWPDVLQWLADINKYSLYYDDLPGDYLSLTTQRSYSLEEARDVINQHLLARGYTMLVEGETLVVVEVSKLNKAMIPRVAAEDLAGRQPHEFVRTSFRLEWLVASDAVTELKPMLSKHGSLHQLASTNRLEAFDTVANLRAIYQLIMEEQSEQVEEGLVRHFRIKHRRAADVMELVQRLMGINPDNPAQPLSSAQMKQIQKAITQAQKSAAGQVVRTPVPTTLVLNQRENSILVTAEPDKMKQIEQAILELDVPQGAEESLLGNMSRMKIYRLNTYDPEPLVKLLEDLGQLDPRTKLEVDKDNRSIMAYASLADHLLINQLIEKVDGSNRRFEVIPLAKLDAESVAGTIQVMMGGEQQQRGYDWDYYYYRRRYGRDEGNDKFQVEADVERNRLLLKANETELAEIKNLLRKLGEDPDRVMAPREELIRVYDIQPQDTQDILDRFRKLWHLNNKLEIDAEAPRTEPAESSTVGQTTSLETPPNRFQRTVAEIRSDEQQAGRDAAAEFFRKVTAGEPQGRETTATDDETDRDPPPLRISIRNGRIIVTSNDPSALEAANRLLSQIVPEQEQVDYKIYTMKHVSPGWMAITLEDFFDIDTSSSFWGWGPPQEDKASLGKKKEMRFITDTYTNTLLVQHATTEDLRTIEALIERFDMPVSSESRLVRKTEAFHIKHSQATVIAEVIKEVYRDLLSGNDKALQNDNGDKKGGSTPIQFFGSGATYLTASEDEKVKFKGQLSVGVDPLSNTLIVSGTEALVQDIGEKIAILDQAAQPASNMRVIPVSRNINPILLQQRLEKLIGKPQQQQQQPNQQQKNGNKQNNNQQAQPQPSRINGQPFFWGGRK